MNGKRKEIALDSIGMTDFRHIPGIEVKARRWRVFMIGAQQCAHVRIQLMFIIINIWHFILSQLILFVYLVLLIVFNAITIFQAGTFIISVTHSLNGLEIRLFWSKSISTCRWWEYVAWILHDVFSHVWVYATFSCLIFCGCSSLHTLNVWHFEWF